MPVTGKINIEPELMTVGTYEEEKDWRQRAPSGPWGLEPFDYGVWTDSETGLVCALKRNHSGAWCGYVFVEEAHPINLGIGQVADYSADEPTGNLTSGNPVWLDCHGGVTYHDTMSVPEGLADGIAVGFDCAHFNDISPAYTGGGGDYRTASYVINEVRSLAKQILDYRPLQQLAV